MHFFSKSKPGLYMCRGHVIVLLPSFTLTGSGSKVVGLLDIPTIFLLARRVVFSSIIPVLYSPLTVNGTGEFHGS